MQTRHWGHPDQKFLNLSSLLLAVLCLLVLATPTLAQTATPGAGEVAPPTWFQAVPSYTGLQKLVVDDTTLAALGINRSQNYISAGTSLDSVVTIADFYVSKLEAAGWKAARQPLGLPDAAQQLTFSDPQVPGKQLLVLVVNQATLLSVPQFKALATQVSAKQTLVALVAPLAAADGGPKPTAETTPSEAIPTDLLEPPAWFKTVPRYASGKTLELDDSLYSALGATRSQYYAEAVLTPDAVAKVLDFYNTKARERGWGTPVKTPLPKDELGQMVVYQSGQLILLVAGKEALNSLPPFKAVSNKVPDGQTLVVLATPLEAPPVTGTRCVAEQECQVGAYKLKVTFDRTRFDTTNSVLATVVRLDTAASPWELKAEIVPSNSTSASVVNFKGAFENGTAASRTVKLDFPISGNWFIALAVKGEASEAKFYITATVEPPPLMDERLAWVLGLSPLVGLVGFAIGQWRLVLRRRKEEVSSPATPATAIQTQELAGSELK